MSLESRFRELLASGGCDLLPLASGHTSERHRALAAIGRDDLSLARLAEAHIDAVTILIEAGRAPEPGALYGVWAAEVPDAPLRLENDGGRLTLSGAKTFCSGAGIVDRALVTVKAPEQRLVEVDLRANAATVNFDGSSWVTLAFHETNTAVGYFDQTPASEHDIVGQPGWYLSRPGFWQGACAPAACWAGGAIGLVDLAIANPRNDAHTMAHLGAMKADVWALYAYLDRAGQEIDANPNDADTAMRTALTLRHLVEQTCSDILRRFARAYGPRPLAFDADASRRYQELDLYIRQSHAERDLEALGRSGR